MEQIFEQVTIFNMLTNNEGLCELDIECESGDDIYTRNVRVTYGADSQLFHRSFREYLSVLYLNPSMKIYLQNKLVLTRRLDRCLYRPVIYEFESNRFKAATERARAKAEELLKKCENDVRMAQTTYSNKYQMRSSRDQYKQHELIAAKKDLEKARDSLRLAEKNLELKKK